MAERKSIAAIWLFGVLWILSHPHLTFRAEVVVWLRNFRTCFTLITNLRKYHKEGNVNYEIDLVFTPLLGSHSHGPLCMIQSEMNTKLYMVEAPLK